jgi:sugar phosphate isomerase/epimerase
MKTVKFIGSLLLSVLLLSSCNCCNQDKKVSEKKNIGLQMYSLRDDIGRNAENIDSIIVKIGEIGYKYVEAANYNDGLIYGMEPEAFKEKIEAAGMTALSCHVRHDIIEDSVALWAWWDKCIETHKKAGMKYIVMPSMPTPDTKEGLLAYCEYYNKIGEKCKAAGMKFGYHNHSYEFEKKYDDGTVMYEYLLQNTNPENVFFEMDVYWAIMGKNAPVELFEKYPGRFELLHIKDSKELGTSGFVGFDAIFNNLDKAGTKYLIVEVEQYNFTPIESIRLSLDYLNGADFVKADYSK